MTDDVKDAGASTAVVEEPASYEDWRLKGDQPVKPLADGAAPSKPGAESSKEGESGTPKPSEHGDKDKNWRALEGDRDGWKTRAEKAEKALAEKSKVPEPPSVSRVAEVAEPEKPVRPRYRDFPAGTTDEQFAAAMEEYEKKLLEYPAKKQAYDDAKKQADESRAKTEEWNKTITESWKTRVKAAQDEYADYDAIAFAKDSDKLIPGNGPIDFFLLQSEQGARLLYYLKKNPAELKEIAALPQLQQFRRLEALEDKLAGTSPAPKTETPKAEEKPKEAPKEPKTKVSNAPKPAEEVGGRAASVASLDDQIKAALARGDDDEYERLSNERDIARKKQRG